MVRGQSNDGLQFFFCDVPHPTMAWSIKIIKLLLVVEYAAILFFFFYSRTIIFQVFYFIFHFNRSLCRGVHFFSLILSAILKIYVQSPVSFTMGREI